MAAFIAALDQGTTSTRCVLFDHAGRVISSTQKEHRQIYPRPGWVEHDPLEIWQRAQEVNTLSLLIAGMNPGESSRRVAALGITNQRETTVVWERATGRPIYDAIVWQDTRTADICAELARLAGHLSRRKVEPQARSPNMIFPAPLLA